METLGCVAINYEAGIRDCAGQNPSETARVDWCSQSLGPSTPALPTLTSPLVSEEHPSPPPELGALIRTLTGLGPGQSLGLYQPFGLEQKPRVLALPKG